MSANIYAKMVYSYKQPMWHSITQPSEVEMTAEQIMIQRFRGGFPIHVRPVTVTLNGVAVETGDFAIVRGSSGYEQEEVVFGYCSDRYQPLQPIEVAKSFDANVKEPAETMAFLGNGNEMFISWVMPMCEIQTVTGLDALQLYGIVRTGFDTLKGTRLFTSVVRPVCWNTITFAQEWAKQNTDKAAGKGEIWKGKGVNKNLLRDLGYWMQHVQANAEKEVSLLQSFFGKIAKTPVKNDAEVHEILFEAFPPKQDVSAEYPAQLRTAKQEDTLVFNAGQNDLRDGIYGLFAGAGTAITPDYYGLVNATSEFFCHKQPSKRPIAESVMFGGRQKNTMRVVRVVADRVSSS